MNGGYEVALKMGIAVHVREGDAICGGHEVRPSGEIHQEVWVLGAEMGVRREASGK